MATATMAWDEPAQAASPRGWLHVGQFVTGFYLDYGPDHYRTGHVTDIGGGRKASFCQPDQGKLCRDCQPGNVLAVRYPGGPGSAQGSRYVETVEQARAYVETGNVLIAGCPGLRARAGNDQASRGLELLG